MTNPREAVTKAEVRVESDRIEGTARYLLRSPQPPRRLRAQRANRGLNHE
jgi:hypothetical protein